MAGLNFSLDIAGDFAMVTTNGELASFASLQNDGGTLDPITPTGANGYGVGMYLMRDENAGEKHIVTDDDNGFQASIEETWHANAPDFPVGTVVKFGDEFTITDEGTGPAPNGAVLVVQDATLKTFGTPQGGRWECRTLRKR